MNCGSLALRSRKDSLRRSASVISPAYQREMRLISTIEVSELAFKFTPRSTSSSVRCCNRFRVGADLGDRSKVFLSHAASDGEIASLLRAEIERRLPRVKVL